MSLSCASSQIADDANASDPGLTSARTPGPMVDSCLSLSAVGGERPGFETAHLRHGELHPVHRHLVGCARVGRRPLAGRKKTDIARLSR